MDFERILKTNLFRLESRWPVQLIPILHFVYIVQIFGKKTVLKSVLSPDLNKTDESSGKLFAHYL